MQIVEIVTEQKKTDLQILIFNFFTLKVISQLRFNCIQHHSYSIIYYWYWKLLLCESIFYHWYLLIYWTNSVIFIKFLHGLYNISFIWTFFLLFISFYLSMDIDTASDTSDSSEDTNIICVAAHEVESFYFCHFLFFCNFFCKLITFFCKPKMIFWKTVTYVRFYLILFWIVICKYTKREQVCLEVNQVEMRSWKQTQYYHSNETINTQQSKYIYSIMVLLVFVLPFPFIEIYL